jgi:hypothetical protein
MFHISQTYEKAKFADMLRNLEAEQARQEYFKDLPSSRKNSANQERVWNFWFGILTLVTGSLFR